MLKTLLVDKSEKDGAWRIRATPAAPPLMRQV
jgi:hypothetical protein